MADEEYRPKSYTEHAIEEAAGMLIRHELWLEDRAGYFTWAILFGVFCIGWVVWTGYTSPKSFLDNPFALWINLIGGPTLIIAGVALRVCAHFDIKRIRRMQRHLDLGRIP